MHEINSVLIHNLQNGKAMQVRLGANKIDVQYRQVPAGKIDDTEAEEPRWVSAYGYILAEWRGSNSAVWQWLKEKGLDEVASAAKQLGLKN
jgi:hypothetical protein